MAEVIQQMCMLTNREQSKLTNHYGRQMLPVVYLMAFYVISVSIDGVKFEITKEQFREITGIVFNVVDNT